MICYYYNVGSILFHIGTSGGLPNVVIEGVASVNSSNCYGK